MNILLVALGGAMGAITRYLITSFSDNLLYYQLPLGTLIVNILGCFAAGCVVGFFGTKVTDLYLFFVIGFLLPRLAGTDLLPSQLHYMQCTASTSV